MKRKITIPLWLFIVGIGSFLWAILDRFLLPSVRWFFRRQAKTALDEFRRRFNVNLPDFKLTKRQVLIDRLSYDPAVLNAVTEYCEKEGVPRPVAMQKVSHYAREIVPAFNAYVYFRLAAKASKAVSSYIYRVRLGYVDSEKLRDIDPNDSIVFVMNHRSNMDYILLANFAMDRVALSYAVGEWARVFPIQPLIRSTGAYFVRRGSGNKMYRTVLQRYVQMSTEAGVVQAMFPEGGLSRDGHFRDPKIGLLDYMLRTFEVDGPRDLVMVPVAVNYDRVLEDRTLLSKNDPKSEKKSGRAALLTTLKFVGKHISMRMKGEGYRFGYAVVNFGSPISLRGYAKAHGINFADLVREERVAHAKDIANALMHAIGDILPVVPVSAVAAMFAASSEPRYQLNELLTAVEKLLDDLAESGAHIYVPRQNRRYAIEVGLRTLTLRNIILEEDGWFTASAENKFLLDYYAASIAHLTRRLEPAP